MAKAIKTATFANGFQDIYKGTRDVKAAWAIILKETGEVLMSGHSLDADKARKTAEGNSRYCLSRGLGRRLRGDNMRPSRYASQIAFHNGIAKRDGFKNWAEAHAVWQGEAEFARRGLTIEIVSI